MASPSRLSRRNFLVTSGTGAAALCVSGNAGGYTGAEMRAHAADDTLTGLRERVPASVGGPAATLETVFLALTGRSLRD